MPIKLGKISVIDSNPNIAVGIKIPFVNKSGGLFDLSYTTTDQAISNLKNLLLTRKGERLYLPEFGSSISDLLFDPYDLSLLKSEIYESLTSEIQTWLPYISITDLQVSEDIEGSERFILVKLYIAVRDNKVNEPISFSISSSGVGIQ